MGYTRIVLGKNDLKSWCINNNAAFLIDEWDSEKNKDLTPEQITYASNRKVWWICNKGHSYSASTGNRTTNNQGCPYCSNNKTLEGFNDFKTWCIKNKREYLLDEWNYEKMQLFLIKYRQRIIKRYGGNAL